MWILSDFSFLVTCVRVSAPFLQHRAVERDNSLFYMLILERVPVDDIQRQENAVEWRSSCWWIFNDFFIHVQASYWEDTPLL